MKIYLSTKDGRVVGYGSTQTSDTDIEMNVSDDHEVLAYPFIFKYENGQLVKDEAYQQQLIKEKEERLSRQITEQKYELLQKAIDDLILGGM